MSLSLFLSSYFHFYSMENSPTNSVNKIDVFSTEEFINDVIWPIGSSVSETTIVMKLCIGLYDLYRTQSSLGRGVVQNNDNSLNHDNIVYKSHLFFYPMDTPMLCRKRLDF